jgi:hypothetical protein
MESFITAKQFLSIRIRPRDVILTEQFRVRPPAQKVLDAVPAAQGYFRGCFPGGKEGRPGIDLHFADRYFGMITTSSFGIASSVDLSIPR